MKVGTLEGLLILTGGFAGAGIFGIFFLMGCIFSSCDVLALQKEPILAALIFTSPSVPILIVMIF